MPEGERSRRLRITQFTPGTGHFYCGSCLRDNTLAGALRARGHDVTLVPLYLPVYREEGFASPRERVFLGGVNMYLQQKFPACRWLPGFLARSLDSPRLLRWLASRSEMTDAGALGPLTVSTIRGPAGRQSHEVDKLLDWMRAEDKPDVVSLSNVMLVGLARRLKSALDVPVVCTLQGEAPFLDALPDPHRTLAWDAIREHVGDVDAFVPVSRHYGLLMQERLGFELDRMHVVHNGIELNGIVSEPGEHAAIAERPPVIGYLARMCADKGLPTLVDAFITLADEGAIEGLRLEVAGVMLKGDRRLVRDLTAKLERAGHADAVRFRPNITREEKLAFLQSIAVLSVPATYGESFGLYILEALAAGVPVVQPRHGAFPEVLEQTGGGLLCEPDDPKSLANGLRQLLTDTHQRHTLATMGQTRVLERFGQDRMAHAFEQVLTALATR